MQRYNPEQAFIDKTVATHLPPDASGDAYLVPGNCRGIIQDALKDLHDHGYAAVASGSTTDDQPILVRIKKQS